MEKHCGRKVLDGNTGILETDSKRLFREVLKELDLNPAGPSENTVAGMPSLSIGLVPPPAPWTRE